MRVVQRMCLMCRRSGPKQDLLRFVWHAGALCRDPEYGMPGRGAYLHRECLGKAIRPAVWERALRLGRGVLTAAELERCLGFDPGAGRTKGGSGRSKGEKGPIRL